ncbi:hypothetical protein AO382_1236 [Moraxella catarrhalis]|uniref:Uncharacterized protein n=1 Tax=Moraxella catarrhalis TaxID=480 RepID=A0A7Z1A423_MORCA|nr:hypothetical protein AO382_2158 [Moraxella catarrhalis]OAV00682.1 hypothetical protein AO382_1236 [Moraxella catarrhalis]
MNTVVQLLNEWRIIRQNFIKSSTFFQKFKIYFFKFLVLQ